MTTNNSDSNSSFFIIFVNVVLGAVLVTAMNKAINPLQDKALIQFLTSKWECKKNVSLVGSIENYFENSHKSFFPDSIDVIVHGEKIETGLDSFLNSFNKKINKKMNSNDCSFQSDLKPSNLKPLVLKSLVDELISFGCSFQSDLKPLVDELISLYWHNLGLAAIFIIFVIKYAHEGVRIQKVFDFPRPFYSSLAIYASQILALLFFIVFAEHLHEKPHYWLEFIVITASFLVQDISLWVAHRNKLHYRYRSFIWILYVWLALDLFSLLLAGGLFLMVDVSEMGINNIKLSSIFLGAHSFIPYFADATIGFFTKSNQNFYFDHK